MTMILIMEQSLLIKVIISEFLIKEIIKAVSLLMK